MSGHETRVSGSGFRSRRRWLVPLILGIGVWGALEVWRGLAQRQAGEVVARLAKPGDIRMLSSITCAYCVRARRWMTEHRVPFDECFIEKDMACAELYRAQLAPGTPTLLVRGERQVGFDPERVEQALRAR